MAKKKNEEVEKTLPGMSEVTDEASAADETAVEVKSDDAALVAGVAGVEAAAPAEEAAVETAPAEEADVEAAPAEESGEKEAPAVAEKPKKPKKAAAPKAPKKPVPDAGEAKKVTHKRAEKVGIVSSDKMTKTVVVRVDRLVKHPIYRKYVKKRKKFMAHDEMGAKIGDKVKIVETRPLSARKRWRVVEIIQKAEL